MRDNYDKCFEIVVGHEGGYVNDRYDPGGETKYGISKRAHPLEDIKGMTLARAKVIYKRDYWLPAGCDELLSGFDLMVFDASISSGVSRGVKWFQRALGVDQDGRVGPATIKASNNANAENVINRACIYRLDFMRGLSTWSRYKNGWSARVDGIRRVSLDMSSIPTKQVNKPASFLSKVIAFIVGLFK